jgi:hypothetical protein
LFRNEFAVDWGAVPGVEWLHVWGHVSSVTVDQNGTVTIAGIVIEKDFSKGEGLVFLEENVPFYIIIGGSLSPSEFILQWCLLPEFPVEITTGALNLR